MLRKRYITTFVLFILLMTGSLYAAEVREVSLLQAVKLALTNNLDVKIAEVTYTKAQLDYKKNQATNLLTGSKYLEQQAELGLKQAEDSFLQSKNDLIINITKDYLQLIQKNIEIAINEKQVELEKKLKDEMKTQSSLGHIGQLDLLKQENRLKNASFNLEKSRDDYQQLQRKLKTNLGMKEAEALKLVNSDTFKALNITETEAQAAAAKNSFALAMRKKQIELAKADLEKAEATITPELELQRLKCDLQLAELNYAKAQQSLLDSIQTQYYLFQQAMKKLELSKQTYAQASENYQVVKKQKAAGLKTENDLLAAEMNLLQEELNKQTTLLNCIINQLQLQKLMGLQIEVSINDIFTQK